MPASTRRARRAIPMWRMQRDENRTVACTLRPRGARGCVLAVVLDGEEIAAQRYFTRVDAVSQAGVLLQHLTAQGWTLVTGMPRIVLH